MIMYCLAIAHILNIHFKDMQEYLSINDLCLDWKFLTGNIKNVILLSYFPALHFNRMKL